MPHPWHTWKAGRRAPLTLGSGGEQGVGGSRPGAPEDPGFTCCPV